MVLGFTFLKMDQLSRYLQSSIWMEFFYDKSNQFHEYHSYNEKHKFEACSTWWMRIERFCDELKWDALKLAIHNNKTAHIVEFKFHIQCNFSKCFNNSALINNNCFAQRAIFHCEFWLQSLLNIRGVFTGKIWDNFKRYTNLPSLCAIKVEKKNFHELMLNLTSWKSNLVI